MESLEGVSVLGRNLETISLNCPVLHFSVQILGLVAKGSFGTVLKVLDCGQKAIFVVKVGT